MLIGVFRFVLPDLASHFVLCDLLRSFRLERPLSSSRVPLWDLSLVLSFLRGAPFEPLSSCSLWDLSRKVLFLVALATACWVGELQAVSAVVFESGDDIFLSYLPGFRVKAESESRSFRVRSLDDFVGDLTGAPPLSGSCCSSLPFSDFFYSFSPSGSFCFSSFSFSPFV